MGHAISVSSLPCASRSAIQSIKQAWWPSSEHEHGVVQSEVQSEGEVDEVDEVSSGLSFRQIKHRCIVSSSVGGGVGVRVGVMVGVGIEVEIAEDGGLVNDDDADDDLTSFLFLSSSSGCSAAIFFFFFLLFFWSLFVFWVPNIPSFQSSFKTVHEPSRACN